MSVSLNLLCAGAVQGLVKALLPRFEAETGASVNARFGAVGAMREALAGGAPCDVMIVTDAMVVGLQGEGVLSPVPRAPLGRVRTGLAVPDGTPRIPVVTAEALRSSLLSARAIYFPDAQRSTAGIHFESVLSRLGLLESLGTRLRTFPNGATAMRELAADTRPGAIGCTQITEILYTPGIVLVGPLPPEFELATVYTAAVAAAAEQPVLAQRLIELLTGPASRELRVQGGFEFD
ncbi:MAG TPA: substrate-binding domain-containing protein [Burkholderiaceae bacterium]|jgi:molybdate transport system substrate-binding protein